MKEQPKFRYSCVGCPNVAELVYIISNSKEITYETFRKQVNTNDFKELKKELGYTPNFTIQDDWAVRFYSSKNRKGKRVYYLVHSAIEYVFY